MTARNDPCRCGSGRKFKKCHGMDRVSVSPEVSRANAVKAVDRELTGRLLRFARTRYGADWWDDALESAGLLDEGAMPQADEMIVAPWLIYVRTNASDGLTLAGAWRRKHARASADQLRVLDAYAGAWLSLWEVAEVEAGVGARLTDLLTGEERFVHDVRSSSLMERFDAVLAVVVSCDGISFFGGLHAHPLGPQFAQRAAQEARRLCGVRTRRVTGEQLRDAELQLDLLALWNDVVYDQHNPPPPVLQNTDGDPFQLTTDDFELLERRAEVVPRLAAVEGVHEAEQEGDDIVFVVHKPGNAMHRSWDNTIVGRVTLSGARLTVETNSTRRADALRSRVETHLHGLVRHRLRKEEDTAQLIAAARVDNARSEEKANEPLAPEIATALRQYREQHLRDWLEESIPALDGQTPREAARLRAARPKLELLLKEMEQREARAPVEQRVDLRWLRETLGFRW